MSMWASVGVWRRVRPHAPGSVVWGLESYVRWRETYARFSIAMSTSAMTSEATTKKPIRM